VRQEYYYFPQSVRHRYKLKTTLAVRLGTCPITKGERSVRQCASKLEEIKQERPGGTAWTAWRIFLRTICKEEREQEIHKDKTEEKHIIGTRITKYWAGKPFTGTVTNNKDKYYKIQYDNRRVPSGSAYLFYTM
jgi:hypothetical protein